MELHHLRHFVAVAEDLHFGRAAQRLGIVQPALTQSIQRLETLLGAQLLERTRRRVTLTLAGEVLLAEAQRTLAQADLTEKMVRAVAGGEIARLRIGFVSGALSHVLPATIPTFHAKWPRVEIKLEEAGNEAQVAALAAGRLDIGLYYAGTAKPAGLATRTMQHFALEAAVPSSWPLARRRWIRLADLADSPLILFPASIAPEFHASILRACADAGFQPQIAQETGGLYTILSLAAAGLGVALLADTARHMTIKGVTLVPIRGLPPSLHLTLAMAWQPRNLPPATRAFIDLAERSVARVRR